MNGAPIKQEVIHTNKAELVFYGDRVSKRFFQSERARAEYLAYVRLNEILSSVSYKQWVYRTVDLLHFDSITASIHMRRATGVPLVERLADRRKLIGNAGVWLGLFHQGGRMADGRVLLFGDFNLSNIIVDEDKRVVWGIDPARDFGKLGYPEYDLVLCVSSILSFSAKRRIIPDSFIMSFLKGYLEVQGSGIELERVYSAIDEIVCGYRDKAQIEKRLFIRMFWYLKITSLRAYLVYLKRVILKRLAGGVAQ